MKVSVIVPCFNSLETIERTMNSIVIQDYENIELIVIDGGSTDGTTDYLEAQASVDRWVSESDNGIYDAMNKGVDLATGELICFLNSDDCFAHDQVVSNAVRRIGMGYSACCGSVIFKKSPSGRPLRHIRSSQFKEWMIRFGIIPPLPSSFFRADCLMQLGKFSTDYAIASDMDMVIRFFKRFGSKTFYKGSKVDVEMLIGGISTSGIRSYMKSTSEMRDVLIRNGYKGVVLPLILRFPLKYLLQILLKN